MLIRTYKSKIDHLALRTSLESPMFTISSTIKCTELINATNDLFFFGFNVGCGEYKYMWELRKIREADGKIKNLQREVVSGTNCTQWRSGVRAEPTRYKQLDLPINLYYIDSAE